jgi:hypothetical protein
VLRGWPGRCGGHGHSPPRRARTCACAWRGGRCCNSIGVASCRISSGLLLVPGGGTVAWSHSPYPAGRAGRRPE